MKKIFMVLAISIFLVACGDKTKKRSREAVNKVVKTAVLQEIDIVRTSISSGTLEPENEVTEITKTGGKIVRISKKNGERVEKGEIVIKLEDQPTESAYFKAKAKYGSSISDYQTKSINFKKLEELRKDKYISEDEFLTKKATYDLSYSNSEDAKATYLATKKDFEELEVKSEITGIVTDLNEKMFAQIEKQKSLFTVVDDSKMYVKTGVSVSEITGVAVGNSAELQIEGIDKIYKGSIVEINPVATKDTKKYQVKIAVDNGDGILKKGMYAKIKVESGKKKTYAVPKSAIVVKDLFSYIFIVENGEAREIKIDRGYADGDLVEIISSELVGRLELVVDGQYILSNKDKITVQK
ncbi:MAG: efflux RND transporter periplasmic adaptor subunit [Fusobacteriaceae bacterium]